MVAEIIICEVCQVSAHIIVKRFILSVSVNLLPGDTSLFPNNLGVNMGIRAQILSVRKLHRILPDIEESTHLFVTALGSLCLQIAMPSLGNTKCIIQQGDTPMARF